MCKLNVWVPHTLRVRKINKSSFKAKKFPIKNIITSDKKWIFYYNVQRKKDESPLPTPKVELQERKDKLCVWWDHHSIIHF